MAQWPPGCALPHSKFGDSKLTSIAVEPLLAPRYQTVDPAQSLGGVHCQTYKNWCSPVQWMSLVLIRRCGYCGGILQVRSSS